MFGRLPPTEPHCYSRLTLPERPVPINFLKGKMNYLVDALILISTPAGRLSLFNASIVFAVA